MRSPLGVLVVWGETYGTDFSVHLSDDGATFREVGRISTGDGGSDSFWWRSTKSRYLRFTVHAASAPEGAVIAELKLRILNKDRMPIGQLERAAAAGRGELYPQALLGRQVYWTALGEVDQGEQALFDEYGDLEPRRGFPQITPLLRLGDGLHGSARQRGRRAKPWSTALCPSRRSSGLLLGLELRVTALAHKGQAIVECRVTNRSRTHTEGRDRSRGAPGPDQSVLAARRPCADQRDWGCGQAGPRQRSTVRRIFAQTRFRDPRPVR